jgi:hypothetical protein
MDEEEFDSLMKLRPFGTEEAARWESQLRRNIRLSMTLGSALWGRTSGDLQRQLLAPHPEMPGGFDLVDFRELLRWTAGMTSAVLAAQRRGFSPSALSSPTIFVGTQDFTTWEAKCEIVRRAIEYLESR